MAYSTMALRVLLFVALGLGAVTFPTTARATETPTHGIPAVGQRLQDGAVGRTTRFWVSPDGSDRAPGTKSRPFRTLQRARDAVRSVPRSARTGVVVVTLRGGTFRLHQPLRLTARDSGTRRSPVVYRAAQGERPILNGARRVSASRWSTGSDGIWRTRIGEADTRQLLVDGDLAVRARTSEYPAGFRPNNAAGGIQFVVTAQPGGLNDAEWADPTTWGNADDVEAVSINQWKMIMAPVKGVAAPKGGEPGLITMRQPAWRNANLFRLAPLGNPDATPQQSPPGIWSMWQVAWFENALEFLDTPGEWYYDDEAQRLHYLPLPGQTRQNTVVEVPRLQTLIDVAGTASDPVRHVGFEGLTFTGATWNGPSTKQGYVDDQAGFHITGRRNSPNFYGHVKQPTPIPGNVTARFASDVSFVGNRFRGLGGFGLNLGTGTQAAEVVGNRFHDIAAGAVQLGGISEIDHHPRTSAQTTRDNVIEGNRIRDIGVAYYDTPGISQGFALRTRIAGNTISNVPWSGINFGWGWGLLDPGGYPGLSNAQQGEWGDYRTPTINRGAVVEGNTISAYGQELWDGGAIYTTGNQGSSPANGMVIRGNTAHGKRPDAGLNTFYTDGGSRFIRVVGNTSYDNPIGQMFVGSQPKPGDPLIPLAPDWYLTLADGLPYGSEIGGCRTYGDITYVRNRWFQPPLWDTIAEYGALWSRLGLDPWSPEGFFDICPFTADGVSYPVNLKFRGNTIQPSE